MAKLFLSDSAFEQKKVNYQQNVMLFPIFFLLFSASQNFFNVSLSSPPFPPHTYHQGFKKEANKHGSE